MTTGPTPSDVATAEDDTWPQRARRKRIIDATVVLATGGGFDAVQMREVAERADVALGTLYRYFPSKTELLVEVWARRSLEIVKYVEQGDPSGSPRDRLTQLLLRATEMVMEKPLLTQALVRAWVGGASEHEQTATLRPSITAALCRAIEPDRDPDNAYEIAAVIVDVWTSTMIQWVAGRLPGDDAIRRQATAVRLLLPD